MSTSVTSDVALPNRRSLRERLSTVCGLASALCLEGSVVVVIWLALLSRLFERAVPAAAFVVLALSLWLAYLADRWLDARGADSFRLGERHALCRRYSRFVPVLFTAILGMDLAVATIWLPSQALLSGTVLLAAVLAYFFWLHGTNSRRSGGATRSRSLASDLAVGPFLAGGLLWALSTARNELGSPLVAVITGFAAICSLNCLYLTLWQSGPGTVSRVRSRGLLLTTGALAGVSIVLVLAEPFADAPGNQVWGCLAAASCCLVALHLARRSLDQETLRLLADAALLVPWLAPTWGLL